MSNDEWTVWSISVIHFWRASVSDAGVSQNGVMGTRATSTGSSLERVSGCEQVKCPTIAANARDRFVWATRGLSGFGWLAGLNKQLQSIKLFAKHGFYCRCNFIEAALNKSANTVGELEAGAIGAIG